MKQLKVSLPDDLRGQLDNAAAASGRSLGNEIRERLEESYKRDSVDQRTRELEDAITRLASLVEYDSSVAWHAHPDAHAVFVQAVSRLLAELAPTEVSEESKALAASTFRLFGPALTKKSDTPAARADQIFRTYLAMQQAAPGGTVPRRPALNPKKGRRR